MGRTYTSSGVQFGGGLCNGRSRQVTVTLRIRASLDDDPIKYHDCMGLYVQNDTLRWLYLDSKSPPEYTFLLIKGTGLVIY